MRVWIPLTVAIVARLFGTEFALTLYHDYSGYIIFTVAILLLMACGSLIAKLEQLPKRLCRNANS